VSPPGEGRSPSFPGAVVGVHASIHALDGRVARVERQTENIPQLVLDMADVKAGVATFKGYEATVKGIMAKGILLIVGAVASTFGITKATDNATPPERTVVTKSATTVKVEACTAMQPGPERDACAIKILTELMGPR
jgi:hypothetical protein